MTTPTPGPLSRTHAELVILSLLAEGPAYGYALTKQVASRTEGGFRLQPAVLYPLMTRLEKQGLVTTSWEEIKAEQSDEDAPGRRRKWYTLSVKGRRRLEAQIEAHRRFTAMIESFLPGASRSGASA
jgi:PadR family transcriptional regulator PadR